MQSSFCPVTHKGQVSCSSCEAGQDCFIDREHLMNLGIMLRAQVVNCKRALILLSFMHPYRWCGGAEHS